MSLSRSLSLAGSLAGAVCNLAFALDLPLVAFTPLAFALLTGSFAFRLLPLLALPLLISKFAFALLLEFTFTLFALLASFEFALTFLLL